MLIGVANPVSLSVGGIPEGITILRTFSQKSRKFTKYDLMIRKMGVIISNSCPRRSGVPRLWLRN